MGKIKVILMYGIFWGFLEATLGVALRMIGLPLTGYIMTGIGMTILSTVVIRHRMPYITPLIGLVAASIKLLNLFIYPVALWYKVFRPAFAITLESLAFCLISVPLFYWYAKKRVVTEKVR